MTSRLIFKQIFLIIAVTLIGTTTTCQSGPGSNENEGGISTPHIYRTKALPSSVVAHLGVFPSCLEIFRPVIHTFD